MKVVFIDVVHPILEERLTKASYECIDATNCSFAECQFLLQDAVGMVIRSRFKVDEALLKDAKNLKFIARSGAGMENIDVDYCENRNIQLINAPEGNCTAVGEHALGMLLSLFNKLNTADQEIRQGKWEREGNRGIELTRKTVGIIGLGNNGSAFAKVLSGFDVEILAYDKYKTNYGTADVKEATLEEIYSRADVLSFHIPQTEETMYWADETFFTKSMKKSFYLLNVARGKIVRIEALIKAIENGKVLGAGLDVLEFEKASFENFFQGEIPDAFKKLLASDKVILSPHVAGWTVESYFKLSDVMADKILRLEISD
ncbi:MAG: NAD(P)-dependent oxidoreductase [Crocinitomicaceae bacterium]|nr:NAD(P)-dependent oxidoreductase [Crocinitomicaceae bacterium]